MMCSTRELELGDDHDGIIELPADAPVGTAFADYHGAEPGVRRRDHPQPARLHGRLRHRPRSRRGGAGHARSRSRRIEPVAGSFPCPVEIRTDDPEGCPAFYGRVIRGRDERPLARVAAGARCKSAGQRPISALVDLTNYLMLGLWPPGARLRPAPSSTGAVVARRAQRRRDRSLALNEKTYTLDADDDGDRRRQRRARHRRDHGRRAFGRQRERPPTCCSRSPISIPSGSARPGASSASPRTRAAGSSAGSIRRSSTPGWSC